APGKTIQLGTGTGVSVQELVDLVGEILGAPLEVVVEEDRKRPPDSEVETLLSDASAAAELLGWRPRISLREGLERTADWIRANGCRDVIGLERIGREPHAVGLHDRRNLGQLAHDNRNPRG